jgi:molybdopterin-guanine dinucleotide biosynthesis protein MobB
MKIIHVAGVSGTGKTTFIHSLIPVLKAHGPVGVIKHIGHHDLILEEGKDTTRFFEAGARISAGIDSEKMVSAIRETDLEEILVMLCDAGMQFAVIEGFKARPYPKIVIGGMDDAENVLMTDPTIDQVLARLDECEEFTTAEGFAKSLRKGCYPGTTILFCTLACPQQADSAIISDAEANLNRNIKEIEGVLFARLRYSGKIPGKRYPEIHLGVCAADSNSAIEAALFATDILLPLTSPEPGDD